MKRSVSLVGFKDGGKARSTGYHGARSKPKPRTERWERDRELVNPQLRSCHRLCSGIRREQGLERGAGSGEQCSGLGPAPPSGGAGRPMPALSAPPSNIRRKSLTQNHLSLTSSLFFFPSLKLAARVHPRSKLRGCLEHARSMLGANSPHSRGMLVACPK
jgi:hypothetical protein